MSFGYAAVGTKDEAAAQLKAADIATGDNHFNEVAVELRDLLVKHLEAEAAQAYGSVEYRYTVKASGHGGGSVPLSLSVTVEPHYIQLPEPEVEFHDATINPGED